jgi:hypothetical protein
MALSQKYLERVRRLSQGKDKPKTVNRQQIARLDAAIKQQRIEREKGGWRGAAKWLEKKFPEDFGEAKAARAEQAPVIETRSSGICQNSELVMESQGSPNASESPQSAPETPPALAPPTASCELVAGPLVRFSRGDALAEGREHCPGSGGA